MTFLLQDHPHLKKGCIIISIYKYPSFKAKNRIIKIIHEQKIINLKIKQIPTFHIRHLCKLPLFAFAFFFFTNCLITNIFTGFTFSLNIILFRVNILILFSISLIFLVIVSLQQAILFLPVNGLFFCLNLKALKNYKGKNSIYLQITLIVRPFLQLLS